MSRFKDWKEPEFDENGWTKYGWRCLYPYGLKLGKNTDIACFTIMNARYGIEIGDNVQIGYHSCIISDNTENRTKGPVVIGENSLIGAYTLILPNVTIPPNSKIPARSILK